MADVTAIGVAESAEIGASRRRILEAGDEEPSRLKRRLSEGTLRQPGELAQAMRLARQSVTGQGTAERTALAQPRHSEVAAALHRNRRAARSSSWARRTGQSACRPLCIRQGCHPRGIGNLRGRRDVARPHCSRLVTAALASEAVPHAGADESKPSAYCQVRPHACRLTRSQVRRDHRGQLASQPVTCEAGSVGYSKISGHRRGQASLGLVRARGDQSGRLPVG